MKLILSVAAIALMFYGALAGGLFVYQRSLIYLPDVNSISPGELSLANFKSTPLVRDDGVSLDVWELAPANIGDPVVVYLHGNAGSLADRSERLRALAQLTGAVTAISFRGYGSSGGVSTQDDNVADAKALLQRVTQEHPRSQIVLYGESMGAAVAVQAATSEKVDLLVLDSPFFSLTRLAGSIYWWVPVRWLLKDQYQSNRWIASLDGPIVILAHERDAVVPYQDALDLAEAAREGVRLPEVRVHSYDLGHIAGLLTGAVQDLQRDLEDFSIRPRPPIVRSPKS